LLPFRSLDPFRALREPNRRRRDEERLSRSEQRTDNNPKNHLTGKAPYKFESISLQRTVRLSQKVTLRGREARLFARVRGPWEVVRSAETGIGRRYGAYRRQCLCWVKFQYRSASDLIQAGRSSCRPAMLRNGLARSSEAEHPALLVPGERQPRVSQQLVRSQIARLAPVENSLRDVWGEIAEADEPREIRWAHALALGQRGKWRAIAVDKCGIEPARSDQQFDEARIGFGCRKRVGAVDPHLDLPPGARELAMQRRGLANDFPWEKPPLGSLLPRRREFCPKPDIPAMLVAKLSYFLGKTPADLSVTAVGEKFNKNGPLYIQYRKKLIKE